MASLSISRRTSTEGASQRALLVATSLLFAASATATTLWCASMPASSEIPTPGGSTMSMVWMRMPIETWLGAAASFLGMWVVMMMAMMLPSLTPTLWRFNETARSTGATHPGSLTALVGAAFFLVWSAIGVIAFPVGVSLGAIVLRQPALARAAPIFVGVVVVIAGLLQLTAWKARHLARCRKERWRGDTSRSVATDAWRHGIRLGVHCACSCFAPMLILFVFGVMDLRAMVVVAAAITAERVVPAGDRVARITGAIAIAAGIILLVRAAGVG